MNISRGGGGKCPESLKKVEIEEDNPGKVKEKKNMRNTTKKAVTPKSVLC